jgi:hypothetical protein
VTIAVLAHGERRAGAEAVICLCERDRLDRGERILIAWVSRQGVAV